MALEWKPDVLGDGYEVATLDLTPDGSAVASPANDNAAQAPAAAAN